MYGNYDGKNQPPKFDLYLGVDLWNTVNIEDADTRKTEVIIYAPSSDHIDVCLVNLGYGNPFISVLELRHLGSEIYKSKNRSALWLHDHYDFSSTTNQYMRLIIAPPLHTDIVISFIISSFCLVFFF